jgi:Zn-dependent metalloprotease
MHIGGRKTYDYWSTVHGRNSYDNLGAAIKAMYTLMLTMIMLTDWNGSVMTYGDGSGTYFDVLTSIDVAAHEMDMLFVKKTANLAYKKNQEQ